MNNKNVDGDENVEKATFIDEEHQKLEKRGFKLTSEIIAYLIVGVFTTIVGLGAYYGLTFTILDAHNPFQLQLANVLVWIAAVTFAYVANRKLVFESKDGNIGREAARFYGARAITLLLDMILMLLFVSLMGFDNRIIKLLVCAIVTVGNYVFSKLWVFHKN